MGIAKALPCGVALSSGVTGPRSMFRKGLAVRRRWDPFHLLPRPCGWLRERIAARALEADPEGDTCIALHIYRVASLDPAVCLFPLSPRASRFSLVALSWSEALFERTPF